VLNISKGKEPGGTDSVGRIPFKTVCLFVFKLLMPHWQLFALAFGLSILCQQANLAWQAQLGSLKGVDSQLYHDMTLLAVFGTIALLATPIRSIAASFFDVRILISIQQRLHDHYLALGPDFHRQWNRGQLISSALRSPMSIVNFISSFFVQPFVAATTIVGAFWHLWSKLRDNPSDAPALISILGLVIICTPFIAVKIGNYVHQAGTSVRDMHNEVANGFSKSLADPVGLMLAHAGSSRSRSMAGTFGNFLPAQMRATRLFSLASSLPEVVTLIVQLTTLLLLLYKGRDVASALSSMLLVVTASRAVSSLSTVFTSVKQILPEVEQVVEILLKKPSVVEPGAPVREIPAVPAIELQRVEFCYPSSAAPVLRGASLLIPGGRTMAIVATSGAGKSTILRLLGRAYDVNAGTITIGGIDHRSLSWEALRSYRSIARCSQEPTFLAESVAENFRLFVPDLTDDDIETACRRVGVFEALDRLAPGAPLSVVIPPTQQEGALSGGERKRLELARSIAANPKVLLLDEPTTGVSRADKAHLVKAMLEVKKGRTCILVEHDLEFVLAVADFVAVLEDGLFVEVGDVAELMKRESMFRALFGRQLSDSPGTV
jgi:ATP-binding cassette, subfamily B, bacterial